MAKSSTFLLLLAATRADGTVVPTYMPGLNWPAATAAESDAAWPGLGHQPKRLEAWPQSLPDPISGNSVDRCWKTNVLYDHARGWPGACLGLFHEKRAGSQDGCKLICHNDPRCSVWQWATQTDPGQCWMGFGTHCDKRGLHGQDPKLHVGGAQRIMHGDVRVLKPMVGSRIKNLHSMGLYSEGTQSLSISRCKAWCYSVISCEYWQYSTKDGCSVDAPWLTTEKDKPAIQVSYPLTTADLTLAPDVIAGEYIQHYCPPRPVTPVPATVLGAAAKDTTPVSNTWMFILLGIAGAVLCTCLGLGCYFFSAKKSGSKKKGRNLSLEEEAILEPVHEPHLTSARPLSPAGPGSPTFSSVRPQSPTSSQMGSIRAMPQVNTIAPVSTVSPVKTLNAVTTYNPVQYQVTAAPSYRTQLPPTQVLQQIQAAPGPRVYQQPTAVATVPTEPTAAFNMAAFNALDANGDGVITREELAAMGRLPATNRLM
eukprot:TRINITY_DN28783_c0_g1_i1.p1 TRINITY_DN28783_c0_g1~~TRINITY_DN28783_c0_g1_i1.p1  ORF type:complete len:482 (-),score=73.82 TRINITY_DN28783_c0_g1_i1:259-1704(-)